MVFNLNEYVRVKLTKEGKEILRKKHAALPPEDENGYSQWQMWKLFSDFGEHIYMGCNPPFDLNIEIPDSKVAAQQSVQRMGLWARISKWFGAIAHR